MLDVLHGGPGISKLKFWEKKIFSAVFFYHKTQDPDPDPDSLEMMDPDPTTLVCLFTCAKLNDVEKNVEAAVHHQDVLQ